MSARHLPLIALACLLHTSAQAAPANLLIAPDSVFLSPQTLIPIDGHRRLNLFCTGAGAPTVIMDAGLGGGTVFWRHVLLPIAAFTRACVYDRAGYGFSDPATRPSDALNTVDDLHRLLHAAHIKTPIVYVGHSIAGLYALLFAAKYPDELAGAVLVDPSFAHQDTLTAANFTPAQRVATAKNAEKAIADMKACLTLAEQGALTAPETKAASDCVDTTGLPEKFSSVLTRELVRQWSLPPANAAVLSEFMSADETGGRKDPDSAELDAASPHFGDKPLIILTQSPPKPTAAPEDKAFHAIWTAHHDAIAKLSSRGSNTTIDNTGHYIQIDQPATVTAAVRTAISEVRTPLQTP